MKSVSFSAAFCASLCILVLTTLLLGGSFSSASAQSRVFDCEGKAGLSRQDFSQIAKNIQSGYARTKSVKASFVQQSHIAALDMTELSSGEMWYTSPGLMKWVYREPESQIFVLKNDTIWLHQVEDKQILVDQVDKVLLSDLPVSFLLGLGDLQKDFETESGCTSADGKVLHLVPREKVKSATASSEENPLKGLALLVDDNYLPIGARVRDISGNVTTVLLDSLVRNQGDYEDEYKLEIPDGVDVLDRRGRAES